MTPMQMAMVAAAVANDGVVMRPFVVERVVSPRGGTIGEDEAGRASGAPSTRTTRTSSRT